MGGEELLEIAFFRFSFFRRRVPPIESSLKGDIIIVIEKQILQAISILRQLSCLVLILIDPPLSLDLNDMSLSELRTLFSLVLRGIADAAEDVDDFLRTASSVALFVTFNSFSSWARLVLLTDYQSLVRFPSSLHSTQEGRGTRLINRRVFEPVFVLPSPQLAGRVCRIFLLLLRKKSLGWGWRIIQSFLFQVI